MRSSSPPRGATTCCCAGRPGSGKTMLARRLPTILPAMTLRRGAGGHQGVLGARACCGEGEGAHHRAALSRAAPHHLRRRAGGRRPDTRPGELSMAHRGVLFLDELPEFRRNVLEVLRQPLEEGVVRLARANHHVTYPCQVMLVAAMNPCPCGYSGWPAGRAPAPRHRVLDYHARISGPLLDRIDITLETRPSTSRRSPARRAKRSRRPGTARAWRPPASARPPLPRRARRLLQRADGPAAAAPAHCASTSCARRQLEARGAPLRPVRPRSRPHPEAGAHPRRPRGPRAHRGGRHAASPSAAGYSRPEGLAEARPMRLAALSSGGTPKARFAYWAHPGAARNAQRAVVSGPGWSQNDPPCQ